MIDGEGFGNPPEDCKSIGCPHLVGSYCPMKRIDFEESHTILTECIQYLHNYEHNRRKNGLY